MNIHFIQRITFKTKFRQVRIFFSDKLKLEDRNIAIVRLVRKIPLARLYPFRTFILRSWQKFLLFYGNSVGLSGTILVGNSSTGNSILKVRFRSALGVKGTEIELPKDGAIYERVRKSGSWETNSSYFLSKTLKSSRIKH